MFIATDCNAVQVSNCLMKEKNIIDKSNVRQTCSSLFSATEKMFWQLSEKHCYKKLRQLSQWLRQLRQLQTIGRLEIHRFYAIL